MRYRRPRYNRRRPSARGRNERIGFNAVLLILIAAVIAGYPLCLSSLTAMPSPGILVPVKLPS